MGMTITPLDGAARRYIPVFGGEREKAKADPHYPALAFWLKPMTAAAAEQFDEFKTRFDPDSGGIVIDPRPEIDAQIFAAHVTRIENLTVGEGAIADAAEFLAARERMPRNFISLFREVLAAIRELSLLTEGEIKN